MSLKLKQSALNGRFSRGLASAGRNRVTIKQLSDHDFDQKTPYVTKQRFCQEQT